jgi:CHAT domain-containing protein
MPGYNFYAVADDLANASEQWHLDLAIARQMVATAAATDDLPLRAMARERLGQTALMAGYPELAKSELRNVKSMLQAAPQQETLRTAAVEATVELARLEIERGEVAAARSDLLSVENAVPHVASRFVASNFYQTRSRLLHLAGDLTGAEESLHAALAIAETELHSLHSDAERLSWKKQTANTYRSLVDLAWNADRPLSALEAWEWYRGANLRARGLSAPKRAGPALKLASAKDSRVSPPPLVRNLLPSLTRQTVLSYAILPDSLIVWAFDDRGITARRIPIRGEELARRARHFYALCSNQHSDLGALREEGRRLYEVLLAPIRDHLDAERALVIEPDNWVSFVPFEALVDAQGRYVSDTYAIAYLPGLRYMTGLRESTPIAAGARALVVGDPSTVDPHLHSLADAAREAEQVHRSIGGQLLTGKQATLKNIERDLPDSVVFHFAGHAAGSAEQVGLVLTNVDASEPTFLTAATLGAMRLRKLQLAVLSACTTEGKVADAESLPRVLLQAGVPHVIATQWNVDSASTAGFMDHFYTALLSGKPVSGALRVAAAEARNTPGFSHPYFWSAFHLLGRE